MNPATMIYCEELEAEVKASLDEGKMISEAFEIGLFRTRGKPTIRFDESEGFEITAEHKGEIDMGAVASLPIITQCIDRIFLRPRSKRDLFTGECKEEAWRLILKLYFRLIDSSGNRLTYRLTSVELFEATRLKGGIK